LRVNEKQPLVVVRLLEEEVGKLSGKRVALLGLAFKADTDDVRETRALPIWKALVAAGADVHCFDPQAGANFLKLAPQAKLAKSALDALAGADAAVVQTEWREFRDLKPADVVRVMKAPVVIDGRRTFEPGAMRAAGIRYRAVGLGRR
ncbi:MAG: UDP binding domain-containing protein, partial [Thermoplasmatota archaeon]